MTSTLSDDSAGPAIEQVACTARDGTTYISTVTSGEFSCEAPHQNVEISPHYSPFPLVDWPEKAKVVINCGCAQGETTKTCNVDFVDVPARGSYAAQGCTLTGVVREGGAVPPSNEEIRCCLGGNCTGAIYNPINNSTGAYSCLLGSPGAATLNLKYYGGTRNCTCTGTATVCNVSF